MGEWKDALIHSAALFDFPIFKPYYELTDEERQVLWEGNQYFHGINDFFHMLEENQYKIQNRVMLARYRGKTICPICHGTRLKKEAGYVKVGEHSISELVDLPIHDLKAFFDNLKLDEHDTAIAKRILTEINNRINFLIDVGLSYLTLNRLSNSLSGGESQRINLATSLGSSLVGSLYILDEPSIGLHSRDTDGLIKVLRQLQQLGNTVVVVEHDEEIIRAADYIIDIGPKAGRLGGEIVYEGDMKDLKKGTNSHTVKYLLGEELIELPSHHRLWNSYIEIKGCPSTWPMTVRQWMAWPPRVRVTVPSSSMRSFSSRCWSTEVVCVSGILCSPFALFCIIMPRPTGGYPSAAGSYHLIFCNFFVFFRLVFDIRLPCSILYNDMELTIRGVVPTALHTPAFFRAGQTRRFFA